MNPGLQVMYEDKHAKVEDLNIEKMQLTTKFNNLFHEMIVLNKKKVQVEHTKNIRCILERNCSQDEKMGVLNDMVSQNEAKIQEIDSLKIKAYN